MGNVLLREVREVSRWRLVRKSRLWVGKAMEKGVSLGAA